MDGGDHDVAGHVVGQLNDHLGQVRLARGDPLVLEVLVEVRLLGGHRLDLDDLVDALGLDDARDDAVRLVLVARPVDDAPTGGDVALELFEQFGQPRFDFELHGLGGVAQVLPVRHLLDALSALRADRARGVAQVAAHLRVRQGLLRALGEGGAPAQCVLWDVDGGAPPAGVDVGGGRVGDCGHPDECCGHCQITWALSGAKEMFPRNGWSLVEARISARCMGRMPDWSRDRPPPTCMRQE